MDGTRDAVRIGLAQTPCGTTKAYEAFPRPLSPARQFPTPTMYSPKLALLVVATAIGSALAQIDTATPSGTGYLVDNCIYGCISQAASSAGCSSL